MRLANLGHRINRLSVRVAPPALLLAGWAAVTAGIGELTGRHEVVWPLSAGALGLGSFGFRPLGLLLLNGFAALRKVRRRTREDY